MSERTNEFIEWLDDIREKYESLGKGISPVNAALFSLDGEALLVSEIGLSASIAASIAAARKMFGRDLPAGDVVILNDLDTGTGSVCEMTLVAPAHFNGRLQAFAAVRGHIPDLGGWELGGFSPSAVDRWAEGARIMPVKVVVNGLLRREVVDVLKLNSRTPRTTIENVKRLTEAVQSLASLFDVRNSNIQSFAQQARLEEGRQIEAAIESHNLVPGNAIAPIIVEWSDRDRGTIQCTAGRHASGLCIRLSGPNVSDIPINLAPAATADISHAAIANALGLRRLMTDAIRSYVTLEIEPGILSANLPAPMGLGRYTAGNALAIAVGLSICADRNITDVWWTDYLSATSGKSLDRRTGTLDLDQKNLFRCIEGQESIQ